jgi:hypothetical protein
VRRGVLGVLVACAVAACLTAPPPGNQGLGVYALYADPQVLPDVDGGDGGFWPDCQLGEVNTAPFTFEATLTRQSDGSAAWMTLAGYSRDATWDGQVMTSTAVADRVFNECATCNLRIAETITLALLSQSQAAAVGLRCPASPLDGGVPAPRSDAGVLAPSFTDAGFDAVLACGTLTTELEEAPDAGQDGGVDGGCPAICLACTTRFVLTGARR